MTYTELPAQGIVFWPVANGDSTTVVADEQTVMQVDLRDMKAAEDDDAVVAAVIDRLAEVLPREPDTDLPRVAVTAITHHDRDHCAGAERYTEEILSDEMWFTPRMWHERADQLARPGEADEFSEHAQALFDEATRRIDATLAAADGDPGAGHRIRIVGEHPDEDEYAYSGLPDQWRLRVGDTHTLGEQTARHAVVEVLGPVGPNCSRTGDAGRNASSMLLRIELVDANGGVGGLLLVGDADNTVLDAMFEDAKVADRVLDWDVMLAGHHCSKHAVYTAEDERARFVLDELCAAARSDARIVASSRPFSARDVSGDDPPHLDARDAYEEDVLHTGEVICTAEYPNVEDPRPVVFELQAGGGFALLDPQDAEAEAGADRKTLEFADTPRPRLLAALGATSSVERAHRRTPVSTASSTADPVSHAVTRARGGHSRSTTVGYG